MKKVCMIAYTYYLSDPRVRREAEALVERGDAVDFICLRKDGERGFETINGVNLFRLPQRRYRGSGVLSYIMGYLSFFTLSFLRLNFLYFRKRYSLIHIHTMPDFLVFAAVMPKILGAKIILDIHDLMPELYAAKFGVNMNYPFIRLLLLMEKVSCRFSNYVITVNKFCWKKLILRSTKQERCRILMNLPDEKIFKPVTAAPQHRNTSFNLIYHGTLVKRYGSDIAIKTVNLLKTTIPEIRLNIIGEGEQLGELIELTKDLDVEDKLHFSKKFVSVEILPEIIAKMDVGIVPNRSDLFTNTVLNSKLLEYVAMETPVAVSRTSGIEYYFDDSMVMFFEPGNEKDLADKILYLYNHPEKRKELVKNALKFFEKYNWQNKRQKYYQIIDFLFTC